MAAMRRTPVDIALTGRDRLTLEPLPRGRRTAQGLARQARRVLLAGEGLGLRIGATGLGIVAAGVTVPPVVSKAARYAAPERSARGRWPGRPPPVFGKGSYRYA